MIFEISSTPEKMMPEGNESAIPWRILTRLQNYLSLGTPRLQRIGAHAKEQYRDQQTDCRNYAYEHGIDRP